MKTRNTVYVSRRRRIIYINGLVNIHLFHRITLELGAFQCQSVEHPIYLIIGKSNGGYGAIGLMLFSIIRNSIAPIYTLVEELAASAAMEIFLGGQERIMVRGSKVYPHWTEFVSVEPEAHNIVTAAYLVKRLSMWDKKSFDMMHEVTGLPLEMVKNLFYAQCAIGAPRALKLNIATKVISRDAYSMLRGKK